MRNFLKLCLVGTIVAGGVFMYLDADAETRLSGIIQGLGKYKFGGNGASFNGRGMGGSISQKGVTLKGGGQKLKVDAPKKVGGSAPKGGGGAADATPTRLQTGSQGTEVVQKPSVLSDADMVKKVWGEADTPYKPGNLKPSVEGVLDPKTTSWSDAAGNEWTRADGGWVQTKANGKVIEPVKGWSEGEIYKGNGTQTGWTESGGKIYKDGVQIIETNDVGEVTNVSYDVKLSDGKAVNVGDTIYSDGKFSKVTGINPDGSLKLESGATVNPSDSLSTFSSKGLDGADVTYAQGADGSTVVGSDGSEFQLKDGKWEQTAEGKVDEAKAKAAEAKAAVDTGNETNAIQYAILILQALEGRNQEDATREVTVEGAQKLQDSQGSPSGSTIPGSDTSLDGSNLSCAANSLAYLLQSNPVDTSLMDVSGLDPTKTADQIAIKNRRNQLLQEYAVSAAIVSAGSNAISSQFYMRVSQLAATASGTTGTLGSMSVLNDSERYPYFEMVRQVALSGVQLGLKGASTLSHIVVGSVLAEKENGDSDGNPEGNGNSDNNPGENENPGNGSEGNE